MKIEAGKLYAVITGDIVDSSKLLPEKRQQLHKVMKEGSKALRKAFKKDVPMNVAIFRGDSWQMLVSDPSKSLRLGLFYRAYIKYRMALSKVDTRMAIGVGAIDFIPGTKVSEGDGEAYRNSGKMLAEVSKSVCMRFIFPGNEKSTALDIVVQSVVDNLNGADWKSIERAISFFEKSLLKQPNA